VGALAGGTVNGFVGASLIAALVIFLLWRRAHQPPIKYRTSESLVGREFKGESLEEGIQGANSNGLEMYFSQRGNFLIHYREQPNRDLRIWVRNRTIDQNKIMLRILNRLRCS
jgi:hypothetical protein